MSQHKKLYGMFSCITINLTNTTWIFHLQTTLVMKYVIFIVLFFDVLLTVHLSIFILSQYHNTIQYNTIQHAVKYNFDLLMMSTWCSKHVET